MPISATLISLSPNGDLTSPESLLPHWHKKRTSACFSVLPLTFHHFQPGKEEASWWTTAPHKGSADLHSLKKWHGAVSEKSRLGITEKFFTRVVGMGQAPQSSEHGPKLLELKELLGNTLRHRV